MARQKLGVEWGRKCSSPRAQHIQRSWGWNIIRRTKRLEWLEGGEPRGEGSKMGERGTWGQSMQGLVEFYSKCQGVLASSCCVTNAPEI